MKKRMTAAKRRALRNERKYIDRAILRLTRSFWQGQSSLEEAQQHELFGLVRARARVS